MAESGEWRAIIGFTQGVENHSKVIFTLLKMLRDQPDLLKPLLANHYDKP
jgi:hypothetical protein